MVLMLEQATHSGGCGFCTGFGTTLRAGNLKNSPSKDQSVFVNIGMMARTASSQRSRLERTCTPKGCSSAGPAPSPSPSSTRPLVSRSRVETFSATRCGWFVVICTIPWPSRMFFVRWLAAPRNTSGAEACEYSSRKWCSTTHAWS